MRRLIGFFSVMLKCGSMRPLLQSSCAEINNERGSAIMSPVSSCSVMLSSSPQDGRSQESMRIPPVDVSCACTSCLWSDGRSSNVLALSFAHCFHIKQSRMFFRAVSQARITLPTCSLVSMFSHLRLTSRSLDGAEGLISRPAKSVTDLTPDRCQNSEHFTADAKCLQHVEQI